MASKSPVVAARASSTPCHIGDSTASDSSQFGNSEIGSVGFDDVDGDGHADVWHCDSGDSYIAVFWGDGTGGTQAYTQSNPQLNRNIRVDVFGRIPAGQDVTAGSYTATVTATIFF
jgi:hypothetical protein